MAKIFLLGTGPLLEDSATVMSGQCLRTWHFAAPLLEAGHTLEFATVPIPGATRHDSTAPASAQSTYLDHTYFRFAENSPEEVLPRLREIFAATGPFDAVVGVNAYPTCLLSLLKPGVPFWADLNGWTMAEGISRAAVIGHDLDFGHFWRMEVAAVLAADRFSAVSARQAWALWGELAMLGRLGSGNFSEPLVTHVPNAIYPEYAKLQRAPGIPDFLRDRLPRGARICLWTGGFNTWTNVELLVTALADAMRREPALCFVSTGGAVIGHDEKTYGHFQRLAKERLPAERTVMLGWAPFEQVLALHAAAAAGINIDGDNIETRFGARNRVTNMLGAGVPVVTTRGTEIAEWMEREGCGRVVECNDAAALAACLLDAVQRPDEWERQAQIDRTKALQEFSAGNTLRQFLAWCANAKGTAATIPGATPSPQDRLREMMAGLAAQDRPFAQEPAAPPANRGLKARIRRLIRSLIGDAH